jgi:hypothetical protein
VQTGDIANPKIPPGARSSIIFEDKDLPNHDLLSVGRLTEHGMVVSFSKQQAFVTDEEGEVALVAQRGDGDLYHVPDGLLTLNLMRPSRLHPDKSAWEELRGEYDFSRHPIAPLGTRVTIFEDPETRGSWHPHGVRGFYVAPAWDHYRCFKVLVEETRRTRITDSVSWHPKEEVTLENVDRLIQDVVRTVRKRKGRKRKTKGRSKRTREPPPHPLATDHSAPAPSEHQDQHQEGGQQTARSAMPVSPDLSHPVPTQQTVPKMSLRGRVYKPNRRYEYDKGMLQYGGMAKSYRAACKGEEAELWHKAASEEFERLIDTTQTMKFIRWEEKPKGRIVSYYYPQIRV